MRSAVTILLTLMLLCAVAPLCLAQEVEAPSTRGSNILFYALVGLGCGVGVGLGAIGSGVGMGIATGGACQGIARNPAITGKITVTLIIGLALMESVTIYALVVALILLFVDPFGKLIVF